MCIRDRAFVCNYSPWVRNAAALPDALTLSSGQRLVVQTGLPMRAASAGGAVSVLASQDERVTLSAEAGGQTSVTFSLLGLIPVHETRVNVVEARRLIPGGQAEMCIRDRYCDGHKLYYSYTLKRSAPMAATYGEGEPTGDFNYTWVEEGKTANDCMMLEGEEKAWFEDHKVAYKLFNGFGLGDGASTPDGHDLMILDLSLIHISPCPRPSAG